MVKPALYLVKHSLPCAGYANKRVSKRPGHTALKRNSCTSSVFLWGMGFHGGLVLKDFTIGTGANLV
jgi:hypothetical protein